MTMPKTADRTYAFGGRRILVPLLAVVALAQPAVAGAQPAPIVKEPVIVTDPVGISKAATTMFTYQIIVNCPYDELGKVVDVVPAEFDIVSLNASCGAATSTEDRNGKGKLRKFAPDEITWDLAGNSVTTPCSCPTNDPAVLRVQVTTEQNHGRRGGRRQPYEPTSCGPLALNDGAELYDADGDLVATSNWLQVATCLDETDVGTCVDFDDDAWSLSCGDCDDNDPATYPGAVPYCDGGNNPLVEGADDDNCDGAMDFPGLGDACDTGNLGVCAAGTLLCTVDGAGSECVQNTDSSPEVCDGVDNDCDGETDEGCLGPCGSFELAPSPFFTDVQACVDALQAAARTTCSSGVLNPQGGFIFGTDPDVCRGYCGTITGSCIQ